MAPTCAWAPCNSKLLFYVSVPTNTPRHVMQGSQLQSQAASFTCLGLDMNGSHYAHDGHAFFCAEMIHVRRICVLTTGTPHHLMRGSKLKGQAAYCSAAQLSENPKLLALPAILPMRLLLHDFGLLLLAMQAKNCIPHSAHV